MNAKRFISAVLSAALCLSLAACSEEADSQKDIGANADNSTTTTTAAEDTATTTEAEKEAEPVELTTENWQDYFTIEMREYIDYSDSGEIRTVNIQPWVVLNEGYEVPAGYENKIDMIIIATTEWRYINYDGSAATAGELVPGKESEIGEGYYEIFFLEGYIDTSLPSTIYYDTDNGKYIQPVPRDFVCQSITGTLYPVN